jgi:hypothetical protein
LALDEREILWGSVRVCYAPLGRWQGTTNLGVRSSNLFGRATYATGGALIIFTIGFCL